MFSTIAGGMRILVVMPTSGSISSMVSAGMYLNEGGLPLDGSQNAPWQMLGANGTSAEFHIPYSFAERFIAG